MNTPITTRDDLSFTQRHPEGRLINWPQNNPGVAADWERGIGYFDCEVAALAIHDETEAMHAIECALIGMGGRYTSLETGFIYSLARAAVLGLRAVRSGEAQFEPVDKD
jgi:hypothetical protein